MDIEKQIIEVAEQYASKNAVYPGDSICDSYQEEAEEYFAETFKAGATWADEHPKSPWIKFKDKHPEIGLPKYVLVIRDNGFDDAFTAYLVYIEGELYWDVYGLGTIPVEGNDSWMPIPKLEEE